MRLSVIIPCYNTEKYVEQCVRSVVASTIKDIEIICVIDGSTDATLSILHRLQSEDSRIKIIEQPNIGLSEARNTGFENAAGEYIFFLDSDDLVASDSILEKCIDIMSRDDLDLIICAAEPFYEDDRARLIYGDFDKKYSITHEYPDIYSGQDLVYYLRKNDEWLVTVASHIFRKDFLVDNGLSFAPGRIYEDVQYIYKANCLAKRARVLNDDLYKRRIRNNSIITSRMTHQNALGFLRAFIDSIRFADKKRENNHELDYDTDYTPIGARKNTIRTYLVLNEDERTKFYEQMTGEEKYYFEALIHDEIREKDRSVPARKGFDEEADVTLAFVCDDGFFLPLCVALQSLRSSRNPESKYRVYVIAAELSSEYIYSLNMFTDDCFDLRFVEFKSHKYDRFASEKSGNMSNVTAAALIKFDICRLLTEDKVLYLDGDTIIRSDLRELFKTDISDVLMAAVPDSSTMYVTKEDIYDKDHYFNSGVILMNLKKMREESIDKKLFEVKVSMTDKSLMDQNVFNLVVRERMVKLPIKYNLMIVNLDRAAGQWSVDELNSKYHTDYKTLNDVVDDAVIVHYASCDKPWKNTDVAGFDIWFGELEMLVRNINALNDRSVLTYEVLELYGQLENMMIKRSEDEYRKNITELRREAEEQKKIAKAKDKSIQDLRGSVSFRLGRFITFIPRKIRDVFRR
ncbi:MAG: glycosyltransferase [Clostridiales bacterium]|nr:glycosyltransferase [Clostridiales bacterium]